jgi:pyruvate/2-oxoacid:ferredoxin oxidoreductase alpha subunit
MKNEFLKGNDAVVRGALMAGCTHYFGYPITPSSEIIHSAAYLFPKLGYSFIQAESEISAINMVYGAASCGRRVMTASSSPGISLKQEGISYLAAGELPCVIVDVMRAGPGLGNIWPEQSDYNQVVKGGGHGNYKCPVLAPNSPQEMCDLTYDAFDLAEKYRTPVYILADGYTGQTMAKVVQNREVIIPERQDWALYSDVESKKNLICSIRMSAETMEELNLKLENKYNIIEKNEVRVEHYKTDDAEMVIVAYGISSRIAHSVVHTMREKGMKVGLLRPITLFPFPKKEINELADKYTKVFSVFELSNGQMVDDVRLTLLGKRPVEFYGRMGGVVPSLEEVELKMTEFYKKHLM